MAGRPIRLGKAAGELNVGLPTIVEFLSSKGITIDTNPNTKLDKEHYEMLCDEFSADQDLKEKSKGVLSNREKRESLSIQDTKKEEAPVVKEEPQLNVEEIKRKVAEEETTEKPDAGLKVVGNIDLNALKPKKKSEEKTTETSSDVPADAPKKESTKAEESNAEPENVEEVNKEEEAPANKEEIETIKIERKKITGPTVLGKIELPVEKQKSSSDSKVDNANKRKRKRIKKVETPAPGAKGGNAKFQSNKPQKAEISEKDIQKEIKDTLARLSNKGGKSKASKNRRQKRESVAQRRQ